MRLFPVIFIILFLPPYVSSQSFDSIFLSVEKLYEEIDDPGLVVLHTDKPENYLKGHIPGSVLFQTDQFAITRDSLYYELPDPGYFEGQLINSGIDQNSRIIICSGWETFAHAFRLYVTLSYFGMEEQTKILDGGIRTWSAMKLPVTTDSTVVQPPGNPALNLKENPAFLVDKDWVRKKINDPLVTIIDARRGIYYSGKEAGRYVRSGHIRNAENLTWTTLVDENFKLLTRENLSEMYDSTGLKKDHTLVAYCHVALRASVIYTVGKALGYSVVLYDGSYNEWDRLDPDIYPSVSE